MRPRPTEVGPGLAWWQDNADRVLRDVCKRSLGLDVMLDGLEGRSVDVSSALNALGKVMLPFLLQTSGGKTALFVIDGALIDGLIEQQMLGKVMPTPRLDRPITAIDAGLSEGFVRATLTGLSTASGHLGGLTTKGPEQDRAALRLALGEGGYDILSAKIDLGPGVKTGAFEIWIPTEPMRRTPMRAACPNPLLKKVLDDCKIELDTRMGGCEASAQQLLDLQIGSVLTLQATALTDVALMDCNENAVARGRLGQLNGMRAVRVTELKLPSAPGVVLPDANPPTAAEPVNGKAATAEGFEPAKLPDAAPEPAQAELTAS